MSGPIDEAIISLVEKGLMLFYDRKGGNLIEHPTMEDMTDTSYLVITGKGQEWERRAGLGERPD